MGLYTMSVSRKYVFAVLCLRMHCFKSTAYYCCITCSFPNNLTNVIIYPKTRFCFGRLGYTLLKFIIVIIIIITHGNNLHCSFMHPLWKKIPTCYFYAVSHIRTIFDIIILKLDYSFACLCCVCCLCYMCVSLCCHSDL